MYAIRSYYEDSGKANIPFGVNVLGMSKGQVLLWKWFVGIGVKVQHGILSAGVVKIMVGITRV